MRPGSRLRSPLAAAAVGAAVVAAATRTCTPEQSRQGGSGGHQDALKNVADVRLHGPLQEAAQDVQRRRRHDLCRGNSSAPNMSDEEFEYIFNVAEALGCNHTTLELPTSGTRAQLKRIGDFAMKKKIYAAYHTHQQGSMTAFDRAFAISKGNMANVDLGHYVAAGNVGGTPMHFLKKHHARTSSFHLKDRTMPDHCSQNLAWGTGDTPIKEILQPCGRTAGSSRPRSSSNTPSRRAPTR